MFGLAGLFLSISPKLRDTVQDCIGGMYMGMQMYAPYSYAGGVLAVIGAVIIAFNRSSAAR
jgi:hypothetical protein